MPDRRFEDKLSIQDLSKMKQKDIIIMTYMQAVKTNGTVKRHESEMITVQKEMKDKIGIKELERSQKLTNRIMYIAGGILVAFNVFDRIVQYLGG